MVFMEETLQHTLDELYEVDLRAHIDLLDDVIRVFETEDEIEWDGLPDEEYDDQSFTELFKQQRVWPQPTTRQDRIPNEERRLLKLRRLKKLTTLSASKKRRRRANHRAILEQLHENGPAPASVEQALPKDLHISLWCANRRSSWRFLPGGRLLFLHCLSDEPTYPRRRFEAMPKHLFSCHPSTPKFARR